LLEGHRRVRVNGKKFSLPHTCGNDSNGGNNCRVLFTGRGGPGEKGDYIGVWLAIAYCRNV